MFKKIYDLLKHAHYIVLILFYSFINASLLSFYADTVREKFINFGGQSTAISGQNVYFTDFVSFLLFYK